MSLCYRIKPLYSLSLVLFSIVALIYLIGCQKHSRTGYFFDKVLFCFISTSTVFYRQAAAMKSLPESPILNEALDRGDTSLQVSLGQGSTQTTTFTLNLVNLTANEHQLLNVGLVSLDESLPSSFTDTLVIFSASFSSINNNYS